MKHSNYSNFKFKVTLPSVLTGIIDQMKEIIDMYGVLTVADVKELTGSESFYTDTKYGWINIDDLRTDKEIDGYIVTMPKAHPIT